MRYVTAIVASNATKNNSLRDAIEAINGTFDSSEAYEEVKIDNDQELDDNTFDIGVGNEENVWEEAKLYEPSSNSFDNTLTENMGGYCFREERRNCGRKNHIMGNCKLF